MKIKYNKTDTYILRGELCRIVEIYGEHVGFGRVRFANGDEIDVLFNLLKCKRK